MRLALWLIIAMALTSAPAALAQGKDDPYDIKTTTKVQIKECADLAMELGKKAKKAAPKLHTIETAHFQLFSGFDSKTEDKLLTETAEKMYKQLCKQFDVDDKDGVWVGKCPIYAFDKKEEFGKFCKAIEQEKFEKAGGFCAYNSNGFVYIVVNDTSNRTQFYDVMVHEGTHGFVARYQTTRNIPTWVNEGLAEYMAALLVKDSRAKKLWKDATREVLDGKKKPETIFDGIELEAFEYGMAHSMVRFMLKDSSKDFTRFVKLLKKGETEEKALKEVYKTDRAGLVKAWRKNAEKMLKEKD